MELTEVKSVFYRMFEAAIPILKSVKEGFERENSKILRENLERFLEIIKGSLPFFEKISEKKEKGEAETKALELLPIAQIVASGIENLIHKMLIKIDSNVLFSEKAKAEIGELLDELTSELRDLKDFIITENPELKKKVEERANKAISLSYEYDSVHQRRLITGICMPKASYLYMDMTDSMRKAFREMRNFAEKVSSS